MVPAAVALESAGTDAPGAASAGAERVAAQAERAYARDVSRSLPRAESPELPAPRMTEPADPAPPALPPAADLTPRWTTVALNVRAAPGEGARLLTVLEPAEKVRVTGTLRGAWAQVAYGDRPAWVHKAYLARSKPEPTGSDAPVSGAPCPDGSAVESGLTSNTIAVYRSVCAAFPSVSSWGGRSGSGDHGAGRALDIMVTGSTGDAIAAYVREHAGELGVSEVIWSQRIWTVERSGEGWRYMEDRGSSTANHYDHVHVSVY